MMAQAAATLISPAPGEGFTALLPAGAARNGGPLRCPGSEDRTEMRGKVAPKARPGARGRREIAALAVLLLLLAAAGAARRWRHTRGRGETAASAEGEGEGEGGGGGGGAARRALAKRRFQEGVALVKLGRWRAARDPLEAAAKLDAHDPAIARYLARASAEAPREQALQEALAALRGRDFAAAKGALGGFPEDSALAGEAGELEDALRSAMDAAVREARARVEASDAASAAALLAPVLAADPRRADALAVRDAMRPRARRATGRTIERIPGTARVR
jgi:hypothetical protein